MSFFHAHSTVLGRPLAFSGAPAMTLTISKGLCNVSVGVSNALSNWILHTAPRCRACTISEITNYCTPEQMCLMATALFAISSQNRSIQ